MNQNRYLHVSDQSDRTGSKRPPKQFLDDVRVEMVPGAALVVLKIRRPLVRIHFLAVKNDCSSSKNLVKQNKQTIALCSWFRQCRLSWHRRRSVERSSRKPIDCRRMPDQSKTWPSEYTKNQVKCFASCMKETKYCWIKPDNSCQIGNSTWANCESKLEKMDAEVPQP